MILRRITICHPVFAWSVPSLGELGPHSKWLRLRPIATSPARIRDVHESTSPPSDR